MERENRKLASLMTLIDLAISMQPSEVVKPASTKKIRRQFKSLIERLTGG